MTEPQSFYYTIFFYGFMMEFAINEMQGRMSYSLSIARRKYVFGVALPGRHSTVAVVWVFSCCGFLCRGFHTFASVFFGFLSFFLFTNTYLIFPHTLYLFRIHQHIFYTCLTFCKCIKNILFQIYFLCLLFFIHIVHFCVLLKKLYVFNIYEIRY